MRTQQGIVLSGLTLAFALGAGATGRAWGQLGPMPPPIRPSVPLGADPLDAGRPRGGPPSAVREKMEQARNDDRQKRLVADTEKLQTLANQLKADVDKTDKYTLSLDVLKRCEEIEKLARSIRDRMKE